MALDVIEQVAIATGRIIHGGTGEAPLGKVLITSSLPGVVVKARSDGRFGVSGNLQRLFPDVATRDYRFHLDICIDSPQFKAGLPTFEQAVVIPAGFTFEQPIALEEVRLTPEPIIVRGIVYDALAVTPSGERKPIDVEGSVSLISGDGALGPPATIDGSGRYSLGSTTADGRVEGNIIWKGTKIRCQAQGFEPQEHWLRVDFSRFVHEEYFYLKKSASG